MQIKDLHIRDYLMLGSYSALPDRAPRPILWRKASRDCVFYSDSVLDYLVYDAKEEEHRGGNPDFSLSNILRWMNSASVKWYKPSHPLDNPPNSLYMAFRSNPYVQRPGFLYDFDQDEIDALEVQSYTAMGEEVHSLVRLPFLEELFGDGRLSLFRKGGVRGHASSDLATCRHSPVHSVCEYIPYWMLQETTIGDAVSVRCVWKNACIYRITPYDSCGFRPVIKVKPNTEVKQVGRDTYRISSEKSGIDIDELLGLA